MVQAGLEEQPTGPSTGQQRVLLALEAWVASQEVQEVQEVLPTGPSTGQQQGLQALEA